MPILQLFRQSLMGKVIFRHQQQAGGILIDTMHQPESRVADIIVGIILEMKSQGIDQSAGKHSCCRVHHHASCLIDDDYILVPCALLPWQPLKLVYQAAYFPDISLAQ